MVYGVCERCSHTVEIKPTGEIIRSWWYQHCASCGCNRAFRVVRQIEQPDGSVIEVRA